MESSVVCNYFSTNCENPDLAQIVVLVLREKVNSMISTPIGISTRLDATFPNPQLNTLRINVPHTRYKRNIPIADDLDIT